jgi:ketopantoate hydroxymethyltransferase
MGLMAKEMNPGTYRIGEDAILVCRHYGLPPKEVIPWLAKEMEYAKKRAAGAEDLKEMIRSIVVIEGVNLSVAQKGFFKDLFAAVLEELKKKWVEQQDDGR